MTYPPEHSQAFRSLLFGILLLAVCGVARGSEAPQEIEVPAWFKNSFLDLPDDIKEATAAPL